jgi:malate synthase
MSAQLTSIGGLQFTAPINTQDREILSDEACAFVAGLATQFAPRIPQLLAARKEFQKSIDAGGLPDFLAETKSIREGDWKIKGIPADLLDRRVEITGPVERKMIINALNANVKVFMADFEDSLAPEWGKVIQGQINMRDAVNRTIEYTNPDNGKHYKLVHNPAVLICRARGLHLPEKHVLFNGQIIPGAIIDFGFYVFHNYKTLLANATGPYFYLPKLQSHLEARWWAEMFWAAEKALGLDAGTIKATVLIETLPAVFQMDEILYELRDHIVALNCGRWDYIFSYIKTLKNHPDRVLPDRQQVTMDKPFLNAYSRLLIKTCHRLGGMAAFIPSKNAEENKLITEKVHADKLREVTNGHDGTWVAHPGLADIAMNVFNEHLPQGKPNNMQVTRADDAPVTAKDLLEPCAGSCTEHGMRHSIRVALQYIEAWINGNGCVPIYGLMEDAATAEISRTSIWQWIRHHTVLDSGNKVTVELFRSMLNEEIGVVREELGDAAYNAGRFTEAATLLDKITTSDDLVDFLTLPAYEFL